MKTIIEMANDCQLLDGLSVLPSQVERFARLVRADEREACAKLLESRKSGANELMDTVRDMEAAAIRARGNT